MRVDVSRADAAREGPFNLRANLGFDLHTACVSPDRAFFTDFWGEDKARTVRSYINKQRLPVPDLATDGVLCGKNVREM